MAKYDVVQKINGNISVVSSWVDNKNAAIQAWHHQCELLISDKASGVCAILDDNLDVVDGKREFIVQ